MHTLKKAAINKNAFAFIILCLIGFVFSPVVISQLATSSSLPININTFTAERIELTLVTNIPINATTGIMTFTAFDADHVREGELIINGNKPIELFGASGVAANNQLTTVVTINTPASYWADGANTLLFRHTSSGGFIIENIDVTFQTSSLSTLAPSLSIPTSGIDFGSIDVGGISKPSSVVLTNNGSAPLIVSNITIQKNEFIETNDCNNYLPVSESCTINIEFIPSTSGDVLDKLVIDSDAPTAPNIISLKGTGNDGTSFTTLVKSGPIVINKEQDVHIKDRHISNPTGTCIDIKNGSSNVTIENSEIGPCGDKGIDILYSSDVTIRNNYIHDAANEGIMSYESHHIAVDSNVIENVQSGYEMWTTREGNLSFTHNFVRNVFRNLEAKNGGNVVQIAFVRAPNIKVNDNIAVNIMGESYPEDLVNVYKSNGTPDSPIEIMRNKFLGGGPSYWGGGIILGDQGGSYQIAEDNILVNPGQYALQIGGGHDIVHRNNKVFSDDQREFTNVGLIVFRYNDEQDKGTPPGKCYGHTVERNEITFYRGPNFKNSGGDTWLYPYYNPPFGSDQVKPNCGTISGWKTNKFDTESEQPANLDNSLWNQAWSTPSSLTMNPYYY